LWGESAGQIWNDSLSLINNSFQNIQIYQKENSGNIVFSQNISQASLSLYSIAGKKINEYILDDANFLNIDVEAGFYFIELLDLATSKKVVKKIIVR